MKKLVLMFVAVAAISFASLILSQLLIPLIPLIPLLLIQLLLTALLLRSNSRTLLRESTVGCESGGFFV